MGTNISGRGQHKMGNVGAKNIQIKGPKHPNRNGINAKHDYTSRDTPHARRLHQRRNLKRGSAAEHVIHWGKGGGVGREEGGGTWELNTGF